MKCEDVKKLLPPYLAAACSGAERSEIAAHLNDCPDCSELARELEAPISKEKADYLETAAPVEHAIRRMRLRFTRRVAGLTVLVVVSLAVLWYATQLLGGAMGYMHSSTSQRALHNLVQFSQPDRVIGFGNETRSGFQIPISVFVRPFTGLKPKEQREYRALMSVFNGSFVSPAGIGSDFIHPDVTSGDQSFPGDPWLTLERSGESTVSTINLSLQRTITLEEAAALLDQYDLKILWLAVEAGVETITPKNMTMTGQILLWGLPGTFSQFQGEEIELSTDTIQAYRSSVLQELGWLNEHRNIIKPNRGLLRHNGLDNSVGDKAAYILEHGINIYGLQLTGPSMELVSLSRALPIRKAVVADVDFWYWR